ncbi:MAG TPA: sugar nucleotide-binding protein [Acidobacteriaceae bacterium]|nr:sugar nucleotide-binding protein [Acidobacteriaceae bacterium]
MSITPAEQTISSTLVVGATGQVGLQMVKALESRGRGVIPTARAPKDDGWLQLDLGELEAGPQAAALLDEHSLDAVLCVAGMTHVDGCESEPDRAYRVNARGPAVLAAYARRRALPFVYFSTDYVFDGLRENPGPYGEDASPNPLSVYGRSKLMGEREVLDAHPDALVVRTTVVYGPDDRRMNYTCSLMRNLANGTAMRVPQDQISTPTYNRDLAQTTLALVAAGARGVFHVAGPELMDRLEFAQRVAETFALDTSLLQGVSTAELGQAAPRPLWSGLATNKLTGMFPRFRMRSLTESLQDCEAELRAFINDERRPG